MGSGRLDCSRGVAVTPPGIPTGPCFIRVTNDHVANCNDNADGDDDYDGAAVATREQQSVYCNINL